MTCTVQRYEFRSDVMRAAEASGWAKALLIVLKGRGTAVPAKIRDQVASCTDLDQLETWLVNAAVVGDIVRC